MPVIGLTPVEWEEGASDIRRRPIWRSPCLFECFQNLLGSNTYPPVIGELAPLDGAVRADQEGGGSSDVHPAHAAARVENTEGSDGGGLRVGEYGEVQIELLNHPGGVLDGVYRDGDDLGALRSNLADT